MVGIFVVNPYINGCESQDLHNNIDARERYCTQVLNIPDQKICTTEMLDSCHMEIILSDLEHQELVEKWYLSLYDHTSKHYRYI
jgi:hypothetical protein